MVFKKIAVFLLVVLISSSLAACGKSPEETKPVLKKDYSKEPAELVFFSTNKATQEQFNTQYGDAILKQFPNYTIKYIQAKDTESLNQLLTSGERIDIYFDSIGQFIDPLFNSNLQYDMTDLIKKHQLDLDRFDPIAIDAIKQLSGGKMYGLPVTGGNLVLYYNKDLFDRFGVSYPKDGMTWEEILALAKTLSITDNGVQYLGLGISPFHYIRMNQLSAPLADAKTEQATVSSAKWETIFDTLFQGLVQQPGFKEFVQKYNKLPGNNQDTFMKDKSVAMTIWLTGLATNYPKEMSEFNWDMVSLPTFKEAPGIGSQSYPGYFFITSMCKDKDQAMEVLKYITSDEFQMEKSKKGTIITVLKNEQIKKAYSQEIAIKGKNYYAAFYNKFAPISIKTRFDGAAESLLYNGIRDFSKGNMDRNTALRKAEEEINKKIAEEKKK